MFAERLMRVRELMREQGVHVLMLPAGADLSYLCGYEAAVSERLTMLIVAVDGDATLIVPKLEASRVREQVDMFRLLPWDDADDPVSIITGLARQADVVAVGDQMWSVFLVKLIELMPVTSWCCASEITSTVRSVKDASEVSALRAAGAAVDSVASSLQNGDIPLVGRTEIEVASELSRRVLAEGHSCVNFAIVAAGANAASPHHEPTSRVIEPNEVVLCDFGGKMLGPGGLGYCSDITRCVYTCEPPSEFMHLYNVLHEAQIAASAASIAGVAAETVDKVARTIISEAGYGEYFIHRTGHGIGLEAHETPYIVQGNLTCLQNGNAFSVEPGIYVPGVWGARIEDILVVDGAAPDLMNTADRQLHVVA